MSNKDLLINKETGLEIQGEYLRTGASHIDFRIDGTGGTSFNAFPKTHWKIGKAVELPTHDSALLTHPSDAWYPLILRRGQWWIVRTDLGDSEKIRKEAVLDRLKTRGYTVAFEGVGA